MGSWAMAGSRGLCLYRRIDLLMSLELGGPIGEAGHWGRGSAGCILSLGPSSWAPSRSSLLPDRGEMSTWAPLSPPLRSELAEKQRSHRLAWREGRAAPFRAGLAWVDGLQLIPPSACVSVFVLLLDQTFRGNCRFFGFSSTCFAFFFALSTRGGGQSGQRRLTRDAFCRLLAPNSRLLRLGLHKPAGRSAAPRWLPPAPPTQRSLESTWISWAPKAPRAAAGCRESRRPPWAHSVPGPPSSAPLSGVRLSSVPLSAFNGTSRSQRCPCGQGKFSSLLFKARTAQSSVILPGLFPVQFYHFTSATERPQTGVPVSEVQEIFFDTASLGEEEQGDHGSVPTHAHSDALSKKPSAEAFQLTKWDGLPDKMLSACHHEASAQISWSPVPTKGQAWRALHPCMR
ncbi:uncharacterized protein LOC104874399 [Fukomys damarensis]|uniref:uncharacterized protein LOC104874399 n=1 Tax=Fukomys damarensis TaxID=885580 RepID=UPI0014552940|nr:uncharacterized protein LOC104874399 [Fukomys damarensis]